MGMTKIGKYDIARELGRGAMGIVYEGLDPYIGRKVAIKTIRFDVITRDAEHDEAQKRFMREARSAGNLSHPNIVTIYEVGEDNGLTYIAMEFIEGESLESMIASRKRLTLDDTIHLISQVGDGLDFAHRKGIVHRDIKPANILVDKEGRPRIVDFGIARVSSSSMTQTNMVLGTPYYMAPEQIAGKKVDHRADLFSLGTILYELLTFAKPFPGDNMTTVIYKIMNEDPPPPRDYDRNLPGGLDYVVAKALAKDPAARYQSGRELAEDLRNHALFEGVSVPAGPAAASAGAEESPIETGESAPAAAEDKPRKPLFLVLGGMMAVVAIVVGAVLFTGKTKSRFTRGGGGGAPAGGGTTAGGATEVTPPPADTPSQTVVPSTTTPTQEPQKTEPVKTEPATRETKVETPPVKKTEPPPSTNTVKPAAEIAERLQIAKASFQRANYQKCINEAAIILSLDPGNPEAKTYLDMATLKYAPTEINRILAAYGAGLKAKTLRAFFEANGTPELQRDMRAEVDDLTTNYDEFQISSSFGSLDVIDAQDGTYRADLIFSEILTAMARQKRVRVVVFEGKLRWDLVKKDQIWKIVKISPLPSK